MPDISGLQVALLGGNLAAGAVIGWIARSLVGDGKSPQPAVSVAPTRQLLDEISTATAECARNLQTFKSQLVTLDEQVPTDLIGEMQSFGRDYSQQLGANVCRISDAVASGEVALQRLLKGMMRESDSVGKFNAVIRNSIEEHLREDIQGLLRLAVSELLESNRNLESELEAARCELKQQQNELVSARQDARVDQLTKIANRRSFEETHRAAHAKFLRDHKKYAVVIFDLDQFKRLNDTYGHAAGDVTLQVFARVLQDSIRENDSAARFGGEEFILLLPDADQKTANVVAERVRRRTSTTTVRLNHESIHFTVSAGISLVRKGDSPEKILRRADAALYEAKRRGRNQVKSDVSPPTAEPETEIADTDAEPAIAGSNAD